MANTEKYSKPRNKTNKTLLPCSWNTIKMNSKELCLLKESD